MSVKAEQTQLNRLEQAVIDLEKKVGELDRKEADLMRKVSSAQQSALRASTISGAQSYLRQADGYQREIIKLKDSRASVYRAKASKQVEVARQRERLQREVTKAAVAERKKDESYRREELAARTRMEEQLAALQKALPAFPRYTEEQRAHDFFISHASEDKESFVRKLAEALQQRGARVWYDSFSLRIGDSLRRSIDRGISSSTFGIVVLSNHFFAKEWPQKELDSLVALEEGPVPRVLPIWHNISKDEVAAASPLLAGRLALTTASFTVSEIVDQLMERLDALRAAEALTSTAEDLD